MALRDTTFDAELPPSNGDWPYADLLRGSLPERGDAVTFQLQRVDVVAPTGIFDGASLSDLDAMIPLTERRVVLDLAACALSDPRALSDLDPGRWSRDRTTVALSCPRLPGRQLLAKVGATDRFAVFQCPRDAIQALVLADAGYGRGWDVARS